MTKEPKNMQEVADVSQAEVEAVAKAKSGGKRTSLTRLYARRFFRNKLAVVGLFILLTLSSTH